MNNHNTKKKLEIVTFNVSLPREVLKRFDIVAGQQYWSRSTLIRLAIEYFISTHYIPSGEPKQNEKI